MDNSSNTNVPTFQDLNIHFTVEDEAKFQYRKMFEENEYGKLVSFKNCEYILDVGANIGVFAKYAAFKCPEAKIISIEPMPPLAECLKKNIRSSDIMHDVAVSDKAGELELNFLPNYTMLSGLKAHENKSLYGDIVANQELVTKMNIDTAFEHKVFKVKVCTLTEIMSSHTGGRISVLKIDVEGMEMNVINGINDQLWKLIDQIVIEVHCVGSRVEDLMNLLKEKGLQVAQTTPAAPSFFLGKELSAESINTCIVYGKRE